MHLDPLLGAPACTKLFFGLSRAAAEVPWVGPAVQPGPNTAHQLRGTSGAVQGRRTCPLGMPVLSLWCHRGPTCGILAATLENLRDGDLSQCSTSSFWCTPTHHKPGSVTKDKFLGCWVHSHSLLGVSGWSQMFFGPAPWGRATPRLSFLCSLLCLQHTNHPSQCAWCSSEDLAPLGLLQLPLWLCSSQLCSFFGSGFG